MFNFDYYIFTILNNHFIMLKMKILTILITLLMLHGNVYYIYGTYVKVNR